VFAGLLAVVFRGPATAQPPTPDVTDTRNFEDDADFTRVTGHAARSEPCRRDGKPRDAASSVSPNVLVVQIPVELASGAQAICVVNPSPPKALRKRFVAAQKQPPLARS
jgi:hypothetical protein